ncbi:MAG: response regulator, partial [Bacteroidota bacterium]
LDDREYWAIEKLLIDPSQNKVETSFSNHFRKYFLWEVSRDHNIGYSLLTIHDITEEMKRRRVFELTQKLSENYLTQTNANEYFNNVLTQLLIVTESEYGFMGEVFYENGAPYLKTFAITNISWNKETSDFYNEHAPTGMEFRNLNTLFGYAMVSKAPVITNEPSTHPKRGGIPHGHPALNAFLGIPVILSDGELVGLIGLANKSGGYTEKDVQELAFFIELLGAIIQSKKNAQQKKSMEERLKETLAEKDALLKALNNSAIVSVTDLSGKIISANKMFCEASGYTEEELIGHNHSIITSGYHNDDFWKDLWETVTKGKTWRGEVCNKTKSGSIFWVDTVINPIYDKAGAITQYLAIRNLITEKKEAEIHLAKAKDQAEASLRVKRRFLANISHEIRTPLHAIMGVGEQIMQTMTETKHKEQMQLVNDSAKVLLNIINDILDVSRMEEGKMKLEHVAFDLKHMVSSVYQLLQAYAKEKNLQYELIFDPALDKIVYGDPVRLRQVLINILGNAIKFTEKGSVRLICKVAGSSDENLHISFLCEDTGIGISEDMKKRLFQDFSQEDESFQRKFGGSGLGLTITHELIKMMGGMIEIESEKHKGTKVFVNIPVEINLTIPKEKIPEKIIIDKEKLKKCRILVAEDNQFNRVLMQIIFNNNELNYEMAFNGVEACRMIEDNDYDIILMDIQMPEMDGIEAMHKIRSMKGKDLPIIAVTANAIQEELAYYLKEGFNDYITKPFTEETLLHKMMSTCKNWKK